MIDNSTFNRHLGYWMHADEHPLPRGWVRLKINPSALRRMAAEQILEVLNDSEAEFLWVHSGDPHREYFHVLRVTQDVIDHLVCAESTSDAEAMVFHSCQGICGSSRRVIIKA